MNLHRYALSVFSINAVSRWLLAALMLCAIAAGLTRAQSTTPTIPTVALASEPLYAGSTHAKPTLTLALSVEFPTVGAAYLNGTYDDAATEYVGYYDSKGCYSYDKTNKYFKRTGASGTNHDCSGTGFSGNFMNWATSSAIDVLRYALTGGDRVIDLSNQTVLQRAILPDGSISSVPTFYNTGNFPSKQITAAQAARALPSTGMLSSINTTTLASTGVYVANCLNQIYFGISATGNCAAAGSNGLLGNSSGTTVVAMNTALPSATYNTTACASESSPLCVFPTNDTYAVAYGAGSKYYVGYFTGSASCSNTIFGDPLPGTAKSCYVAKVPTATPSAFLTSEPYFQARVQVCDTADAAARPALCQQYPSGNFKPVGNLQAYSDRIRVAVFGYLLDQSTDRYGGVLRAPMKYVGPKTYDSNFALVSGANPVQEWDSTTGVFLANPNSDTMGVSGAINYLNHFGRTSTLGFYKRNDPVSELYYESLRYLQGLQPTNNSSTDSRYSAISGLTTSANDPLKDGFPVYSSWTDPLPAVNGLSNYGCIKNNILTIGDVNTHYDRYVPGNPSSPGGDPARSARPDYNEPNFYDWTKVVGAFESNHTSVSYVDGSGATRNVLNPKTTTSGLWGLETQIPGDQNGYYMAGIAYWATTHDIRASGLANYASTLARPGVRVTSYFIDVNENGSDSVGNANHRTNAFYLAAKYGGFTDVSTIGNPFLSSPTDTTGTDANWANPGSPFDPQTYFLGSNGSDLIAALSNVFQSLDKQAGSIAGGGLSASTSNQTLQGSYQAKFDPTDWSGDLVNYPITTTATSLTVGTDANATWRVSTLANSTTSASTTGQLDAMAWATRKIFVGRKVADTTNGAATTFDWSSTALEQATRDALQTPPYTSATTPTDPATTGQARLNFLRGDNTNEAPTGALLFRKRTHKLGDIINSGVTYKGAPDPSIIDTGYSVFYSANASRAPMVYVGANDGMLHAFNASTGAEVFAYIPSMVIPKLAGLTSTSYLHTSFVDSTPTVAEANLSPPTAAAPSSSNWKTVLVSGLGAGGQGVFALDVTSPTTFAASNALWEFRDTDDTDMGNVIGRPQIVKVRTSALGATTATYRWFAAVASGVNNNLADGKASDGSPALFLLDLAKQPGAAWVSGQNYFKIKFPAADTTKANGIVGFGVYSGDFDEVRYIYAGDLQGRLWKLDFTLADFSTNAPSNWSLSTLSSYHDTVTTTTPLPFFTATDTALSSTAKPQAISVEPAIFNGPNHGLIVVFGTGRFLEVSDVSTTPYGVQSIYSVYDDGTAPVGSSTTPGRASLMAGTLSATGNSVPAFSYGRPTTANASVSPAIRAGWVSNLPDSVAAGERVISSPQAVENSVVGINSIEPPLNTCGTGASSFYLLNPLTGSGTTTAFNDLSFTQIVWLSTDTTLVPRDNTGLGGGTSYYQTINQTATSGTLAGTTFTTSPLFGRLSWRQILNN